MAPINLPDGSQVSEIVLPDGSTASEVLAPDGSTVFSAIPDSAVFQIDATTLNLSDGDAVTSWTDQIGSNDLSGGDPIYSTTDDLNPTVIGDGTDDQLSKSSPTGLPTNDSARTVILLFNPQQINNDASILSYGDTINVDGGRIDIKNSTRNSTSGSIEVEVSGGYAIAEGVMSADSAYLITIRLPQGGSANDITIRVNGSDETINDTVDIAINTNSEIIRAFERADGSLNSPDGLSEAILYDDELTGSSLSDEENRLADKWGITI